MINRENFVQVWDPIIRYGHWLLVIAFCTAFVSAAFADTDEHEESEFEEFWEGVHEILANLTLMLVGLHIAGVLFSSYLHKENLIKSMITGHNRGDGD